MHLLIGSILFFSMNIGWSESQWASEWIVSCSNASFKDRTMYIPESPVVKSGENIFELIFTGEGLPKLFDRDNQNYKCNDVFSVKKEGDKTYLGMMMDLDYENENRKDISCIFALSSINSIADCAADSSACEQPDTTVTNVNDLAPVYTKVPNAIERNIKIEENIVNPNILEIEAQDTEFDGDLLIYIEGRPDFPFTFTSVSKNKWTFGVTGTGLDFESRRSYILPIILEDEPDEFGNQKTNTELTINVEVIDVGDNPPQWVQYCSLKTLLENSPLDEDLFIIKAEDVDSMANSIEYNLEAVTNNNLAGDSFTELFEIQNKEDGSALVRAKESLDREDPRIGSFFFFEFSITAKESACEGECEAEPLSCYLRLNDMNDEKPKFSAAQYTATVEENFLQQIPFKSDNELEILISDLDQYDSGFNRFTIQSLDNDFVVNPQQGQGPNVTLIVRALNGDVLDYETRTEINLKVQVLDTNNSSMESTADLVIYLSDVNDNSPEFSQPEYSGRFPENLDGLDTTEDGKFILPITPSATDNDISDNFGTASIEYQLKGAPTGLTITIIDELPRIVLEAINNPFDYEFSSLYTFQVVARDMFGAGRESVADVKLTVDDVNDEDPVFTEQPSTSLCFYENSSEMWPEDLGGCVNTDDIFIAIDRDSTADLALSINWDLSRGFDRDGRLVGDKNLYRDRLRIEPVETTANRTEARLAIVDGNFIDYESVAELEVIVEAIDKNAANQNSEISIGVIIKDLDDTAPSIQILPASNWQVQENKTGEISTLKLIVSDNDRDVADRTFTFEMSELGETPPGLINFINISSTDAETEFILNIVQIIDREGGDIVAVGGKLEYSLAVQDSGGNNQTEQLSILVTDINDCTPYFNPIPLAFSISEDSSSGTIVTTVKAKDDDISDEFNANSLRYTLPNAIDFKIDPITGEITVNLILNNELDRETQSKYTLNVIAIDELGSGDKSEPKEIVITITDVNDNAPQFKDPENYNRTRITNTQSVDSLLVTFDGSDRDEPNTDNSLFDFSITDKEEDFPFELRSSNLFLVKDLKNPEVMKTFSYTLMIKDRGEPSMNTTLQCEVVVEDINDQIPNFFYPPDNHIFWIDENYTVGEPIKDISGELVRVAALDLDANPDFNTVSYALIDDDPYNDLESFFDFDSVEGTFVLLRNLAEFYFDVANKDEILLTIKATDGMVGHETQITIKLKLIRNYPPYFESDPIVYNITEEDGAFVVDLPKAKDRNNEEHPEDEWTRQEICYFLMEGDPGSLFSLDKESNSLTATNQTGLNRDCEGCESYKLLIAASNDCVQKPQNISTVAQNGILTVTVVLIDINDEIPYFEEKTYFASVLTSDNDNDLVTNIKALDLDSSDHENGNYLKMSIDNITVSQGSQNLPTDAPFKLTQTPPTYDGEIRLNFGPTSLMSGFYELTLKVEDNAEGEPHYNTADLKIVMITPENVCNFRFVGYKNEYEAREEELVQIFNYNFHGWRFAVERITDESTAAARAAGGLVQVISHFIDETSFEPIPQTSVEVKYQNVLIDLLEDLAVANFTLKDYYDQYPADSQSMSVEIMVLIILTSVFGLSVVFLVVTNYMRLRKIKRQQKALTTPAMATVQTITLQDNVPGTNEFSDQGANPFWQAAMESTDFDENFKFDDSASESSGDSILIGVEEQTEFQNYKGDLDMDLYSRVAGKGRTLDAYQARPEHGDSYKPQEEVFTIGGSGGGNPLYSSDNEDEHEL